MAQLTECLGDISAFLLPKTSTVRRAARHLSRVERAKLFSADIDRMRTAEGRWYEAIIYETFVEISAENDAIRSVALKGADAPRRRRNARLGQNGIFYSRSGDITIRGNGQDLAEFDLLMVDAKDRIMFAEVLTSPSDLKEFEVEVQYKRNLLGYLFNQPDVPFLLVSSFDISHYSAGRRILQTPHTYHIRTGSCESIKASLDSRHAGKKAGSPAALHGKMVDATTLMFRRPFDYQKFHDWQRNWVFSHVSQSLDVKNAPNPHETAPLVKKILYGGLFPSAVRSVCRDYGFEIRGKKVGFDELQKRFSKMILATDLPGYEPLIYLRSREKKEYLKMVLDREGNFKFERNTPPRVGFFLWLESLTPSLGSRITHRILEAFSPR